MSKRFIPVAALGLAQLEQADWHLERRQEIASWYRELLSDVPGLSWQATQEWATHVHWLFTVVLDEQLSFNRDALILALEKRGIETRPVFYPMHILPPYREESQASAYPVAEGIARRGLSLPTWAGLTLEDIKYVCDALSECLLVAAPTTEPPSSAFHGTSYSGLRLH